jgi:hypothetical protein
MHRLATPRVAVVALVLSAMLVAGAVAYAAIPDSSGAIQACYGPTGALRAVDEPADCRGSETSIALGGPTYGYEFSDPDFISIDHTTTVVGALHLPAGKYLVHGKLDLFGLSPTDEAFVVCNLRDAAAPGTNLDSLWNTLEPGGGSNVPSESAALQTSLVLSTAGTVQMTCVRADGAASPAVSARYRKLDAVQVDGLTPNPPPPLP